MASQFGEVFSVLIADRVLLAWLINIVLNADAVDVTKHFLFESLFVQGFLLTLTVTLEDRQVRDGSSF